MLGLELELFCMQHTCFTTEPWPLSEAILCICKPNFIRKKQKNNQSRIVHIELKVREILLKSVALLDVFCDCRAV